MPFEPISIPSADLATQLQGELALPVDTSAPSGAVLIVPGGWFTERDGFLGNSYTEADLMYRRIGQRIAAHGYAVARYDNRGVTGNELTIGLTKDSPDPLADTKRFLRTCVDAKVRQTVTPDTLAADAETVFRYVADHAAVDADNLVVFAHSEGGLHIARLIGGKRIDPKGVVFAGVIAESPKTILQWQMIDKYVDAVRQWDRNGDGNISATDVAANYGASFFAGVGITQADLNPPDGVWNQAKLRAYFTARYEQERETALNAADDRTFPISDEASPDFVAANIRWWKQWFVDDSSTMELLRDYRGQVAFHFGEIDSQLPATRELQYVNQQAVMLKHAPIVVLHKSRGHAFRSAEPMCGPMDQEAEDLLVQDILLMLSAAN